MVARFAVSFASGGSRAPWHSICGQLAIRPGRRTLRLRFLFARRLYDHNIRSVTTPSAHAVVLLLTRDQSHGDEYESDPSCFYVAHLSGFCLGGVGGVGLPVVSVHETLPWLFWLRGLWVFLMTGAPLRRLRFLFEKCSRLYSLRKKNNRFVK